MFQERSSISNYMYSHMGHFAAAGEALCKSLFLGGVTRRFPRLRVAFLEGGVSAACRERRGGTAIERLNPARLDEKLALDLFNRYGAKLLEGRSALSAEECPGRRVRAAQQAVRRDHGAGVAVSQRPGSAGRDARALPLGSHAAALEPDRGGALHRAHRAQPLRPAALGAHHRESGRRGRTGDGMLVDFWASWCGPCHAIAPVLEDLAADYGDALTVAKIDVDENPQKTREFGVRGIPTLVLFKDGDPVETLVGAQTRSSLGAAIERARG